MIRRVGVVVHGGKPAALAAARSVRRWADGHGIPVSEVDVWDDLEGHPRVTSREEAARAGDPDLIVTIGGDGTYLRGARVAAEIDAAVLGVDVGRVGFLTEVTVGDIAEALDAVLAGQAQIEQRLTLTLRAARPLSTPAGVDSLLRINRGRGLPSPTVVRPVAAEDTGWGVALDVTALNDVVFEKLARDRQVSLGVYVSGQLFAAYSADAVIVSTPTGSTAYSFAAGGPVLSPRLAGLVFTPVAPHMIFDRSLVLAADELVAVHVLDGSGSVAVSVDGQLRGVLEPGDWVAVYAGTRRARLIRLGPNDFVGRLRSRLGLTDAAAAVADGPSPMAYRPNQPVPEDLRHLYLPPTPPPGDQG